MSELSPERRDQLIDALRRGTVPASSLDLLAVGLERFEAALDGELGTARRRQGVLKAVRGEYGSGKTFFSRWLAERARQDGFVTAEVQVSETETPLHHLQTIYRRLVENLATSEVRGGALRTVIDGWFFALEEEALAGDPDLDDDGLLAATGQLMEKRLADVTRQAPTFAACLRGYREALAAADAATAEGLLAWLSGIPNIAAKAKRRAGIKGEIDHFGALSFLAGLLTVLRDSGYGGLRVAQALDRHHVVRDQVKTAPNELQRTFALADRTLAPD